MHRHLLGDDKDLLERRIHPDQLGHAIARRGGREIDHAAIEPMARLEPFEHAVVDGDVPFRRLHELPAPTGRSAEYDIAAGIGVTDRCNAARLAAKDVEYADAVPPRRHILQHP